jgi:PKD repeat protein
MVLDIPILFPSINGNGFFDDGTTPVGQATAHSYNTTGSHPVKLVVTDINGCSDSTTTGIIADALPANPTYGITQATCANSFGSLNITNPIGSNFQYSIDGTNYQVSPLFSNLPVRSYNLTVKNTTTNCVSLPINLSINAAKLACCCLQDHHSTVLYQSFGNNYCQWPARPDLQYSIDGINYQTATSFTNVATGSYNLTVKNITSTCVSLPTNVTIDPPLTAPAIPSSNITQPVCSNQNGTVTVTSPLGINLQYSINDINYQAGINFNNIAPGNYRLTVKNTITNCISLPAPISIITGTGTPPSPTASVSIQPIVLLQPAPPLSAHH